MLTLLCRAKFEVKVVAPFDICDRRGQGDTGQQQSTGGNT